MNNHAISFKIIFVGLDSQWGDLEINNFISSHDVLDINQYSVSNKEKSCIGFVIQYKENKGKQTPREKNLFDFLRSWRLQFAKAKGLPAYVIFNDACLREIVVHQPSNRVDLAKIKGFGESKIQEIGDELIAKIAEFIKNETNKQN